ncbi:AraC family transcriptional regulator [Agrobacterium tumefaciens]|uniref:AraC family transcriptional regulator n=1 Tax=Agrobacterium tumefaciens TaxID=358 RepID=UPI00287C9C84|nr:AraC family transcriptional regulator [Agrobacterium tumefaciens]MDS7595408.1 AraC family transcriptional regulator [Agrobacterium tumefaciens]
MNAITRQHQPAAGAQIAKIFGLSEFQSLKTTGLRSSQITVTRLWTDQSSKELTPTIPTEKASVFSFQLEDLKHHELWKFGRLIYSGGFQKDTLSMVHLEEEPRAYLPVSYDCLQFHIPDLVLKELCDLESLPSFQGLEGRDGRIDPIVTGLCRSLLPALANPASAGRMFFDHVGIALCRYLLGQYRGASRPMAQAGSLTRIQMNRVEEFLLTHLATDLSLDEVAAVCDMPTLTFSRAFRQSTGLAVHQWLRLQRIEFAAKLLRETMQSIASIAYECGFTDQAHLTRLFRSRFNVTPGAYRKAKITPT